MGFFNISKVFGSTKKLTFTEEHEKCLIKTKLSKGEMTMWAYYYYKGHTSYKSLFKYVLFKNPQKLNKLMDEAVKKAKSGCNIDITYVRFYHDNSVFIDLPFDIFSEKQNMRTSRLNTKIWHKANLNRILSKYPNFISIEESTLREFLMEQIHQILLENN